MLSGGKESLSPDDFKGLLEMLKTGTVRLNKMVEDFLLVVRIDSGEIEKEVDSHEARISVRSVVNRLFVQHEEIKQEKNLAFHLNIVDESLWLYINPLHLENIVSRLFDNACKFSPAGSAIEVDSDSSNERYTLRVTDNGKGIPRNKQEGLFQKFYQVSRESQEQQGAGLGLYIAKKFAELNKCDLRCESEEGKGATFSLSILKKVPL